MQVVAKLKAKKEEVKDLKVLVLVAKVQLKVDFFLRPKLLEDFQVDQLANSYLELNPQLWKEPDKISEYGLPCCNSFRPENELCMIYFILRLTIIIIFLQNLSFL